VRNGVVYIGSDDGHVYALRASNGARLWRASIGGRPSAPAVVGSVVYVRGDDSFAYAFDAATGKLLWRTSLLGAEGQFPAAPTVAGGVVYVMDEGLVALDAKAGAIRWRRLIDCFSCPVAVANGTVYTAASDQTKVAAPGRVYALKPATGKPRWTTSLGGTGAFTPSVANGVVYVGVIADVANSVRSWAIAAFDAATGRKLWRTGIGLSKYLTWASAAVVGGRVVVPSTAGRLIALDAKTGRYLWNVPFPVTNSAPAIANGVVYIGSTDEHIYAFDVRTGRRLWRVAPGGEITSSPTVAGGTLIVGSDDGVIRAFRLRGK
jgi:outer membrane protein assembly factor BamB